MTYLLENLIKFVEIEVNSHCNRKCHYCPVSVLSLPDVPLYMSNAVFSKIIDELIQVKFSGVLSYHFYNEPLLRDDLEELIVRVTNTLPDAFQVLYTNGDKLSNRRYESLCNAGIKHFIVTRHAQRPIDSRARQTVLYPEELQIVNRGGIMSKLDKPLTVPCYSPHERLIVTVTGDVLLCCNDAKRSQVMGNIADQTLKDIWFGKEFVRIREQLKKGKRYESSPICRHCDDTEYFAPGEDHHKEIFE